MELMDSEMPVTVEGASTSAIPRRRTHHEIIDVDEFDDEHPSRRPRRPVSRGNSSRVPVSSDVIILDSDDGSEASPSPRRRPSRKATLTFSVVAPPNSVIPDARLRSPPPPVQFVHLPPPVPPLPRPRPHRHPHVFPPDVIRPNAEPFAFETAMAPPHVTRPTSHPPPGDLPHSRHHPIINLGGGFITTNHQLEDELIRRQQARDRARQHYFDHLRIARGIHQRHGFLSQTIGRIFPSWLFGDPTQEEMMDALAFSELAEPGPFGFRDDRAQFQRTTHEYRVAYTHPYPPAPGFTHNFESPAPLVSVIDVDDEPGPSTKASGSSSPSKHNENFNTLVCAHCLDPLVLGGSSMSEDERTRRRLWSLRCGHMLDGKCVTELMKPRPAPDLKPTGTDVAVVDPHGRLQGQDPSTQSQVDVPSFSLVGAIAPDVKSTNLTRSKGKARAIEQPSQSSQPTEGSGERLALAEGNSIRSRLRPRNNLRRVTHIFSSLPASPHVSSQISSHRSSVPITSATPPAPATNTGHQLKRRARGKGKQKATEPVILERHEWRCPVALCERLHLSLNIESRGWIMDETQGAIQIFV
jgi:hypothetical protein